MTMTLHGISGYGIRTENSPGSEKPRTSRFSAIMKGLGHAVLATGKAAATMIPGAAAIAGLFDSFGFAADPERYAGMTPTDMLGIQQNMLMEARIYTLLSNIMRIRHDAAMNAIRNIK